MSNALQRRAEIKRFVCGAQIHMRLRRTLVIFLCIACCVIVRAREQDTNPTVEVTYAKDIAPILQTHCVGCHRPNDIAPMSLMTYGEVLPFARMIREAVVQRKMPPWHADPAFGEFTNDARLSDADVATIDAWVKGGAKRGEAAGPPAAPMLSTGWHIKPDVVLTIPEFSVSKTT